MRIEIGSRTRVVLLAFGLAALTACASAPAPVAYRSQPVAASPTPRPVVPFDAALASVPFDAFTAPRVVYDEPHSECVPFARNASGVAIYGDAVTWWEQAEGRYPRSSRPAEGSVFVMRGYNDDKRGHVAVVSQVVSERMIRVNQANWLHAGEISYSVPVIDVSPDNSWSEVRMWYVPSQTWGGRIYLADGFIHPIPLSLSPIG